MGARKFILLTIFVVLLGTSREAWAQKISIHMNNATLEEVLKKIKKKTKYDMMYQMKDVKEIVLKQHTNLMNSRGVNKQSSEDMTFGRDDAIDSLGIVEFILGVEEELGIELDGCLQKIRLSKTVGEVIQIIEEFCKNS